MTTLEDKIKQLSQYWNIPKEDLEDLTNLAVQEYIESVATISLLKAASLNFDLPDYLL